MIAKLDSLECWRIGAPVFLDLGVIEPTLFRNVDPPEMGELFRAQIKPNEEWFRIAEDLGRFVNDHKMLSVALMRIAAVRLVGT